MKLSFRLLTGFGLVSALLVTIIISANISIKKIQDDNKLVEQAHYIKCTFQDKYIDHIKWAQKIAQALLQSGNTALDIQTNPHLCDFGKWYYGEGRKQTEDLVPELKGVLDSIAQSHNTLHTSAIEIIASLEKNDKALALRQFSTNTMPALNIVGSQIMHINQSVTNHLQEINTRAEKDIRNQKIKIGIMGIIALTISILSGFLITKPVTRGISGAVKASKQLAEGNLNIEIEERFMNNKDEIGELTRAMHDTALKLAVITESIRNGAEQVSMASKHVNSASYTISSAASQQAASVEQISSTIDQMTATIHQNTENAQTTEQVSALTASKINEMMSAASKSVESVRLITDKINIINDIAAQTNILALNAAVESANAGEMGRGFTVVAAEVRKLAERSKAAASEIMELSQQTLTMTETAGLLMHEMLPGIEKTAGMVKEISASSREQNTATSQINTAIQQLDHVTQENASASEELANSSTELAALAEQLINVINYFKN